MTVIALMSPRGDAYMSVSNNQVESGASLPKVSSAQHFAKLWAQVLSGNYFTDKIVEQAVNFSQSLDSNSAARSEIEAYVCGIRSHRSSIVVEPMLVELCKLCIHHAAKLDKYVLAD